MKKFIIPIILSCFIIISSITSAIALDLGTGYSFVNSGSVAGTLNCTFAELSDMASTCNRDLKAGYFGALSVTSSVEIYWVSGYGYVIGLIGSNGVRQGRFLGNQGNNKIFVAVDDPEEDLSAIRTVVNNIKSVCDNIFTKITSVESKITTLNNTLTSIFGVLQQTYFCSYSVDGNGDPYPINHISKASAYQLVSELNMKMQGKKIQYISEAGGYSDYYMISAYYNASGYIAMTIANSNQSSYYNVYLCDSRRYLFVGDRDTSSGGSGLGFDDSDILQAIDDLQLNITNSIGDLGVTVNQSIENNTNELDPYVYASNTGGLTIKISRETADNMIAYLNNYKLGRTVYVVGSNYSTTPYLLRGAYITNDTGRIRLLLSNNDGTDNSTAVYLSNARTAKYTVENSDIESAILSIPQKLDDILEWLDNADLVTNQDLEDMIQEFQSDIDTAESNIKNGAKLFKATFGYTDDGYSLGDILSCISTMNEFWGMPE